MNINEIICLSIAALCAFMLIYNWPTKKKSPRTIPKPKPLTITVDKSVTYGSKTSIYYELQNSNGNSCLPLKHNTIEQALEHLIRLKKTDPDTLGKFNIAKVRKDEKVLICGSDKEYKPEKNR